MNIFILERNADGSIDWVRSAESHDNYRIVKMPLEVSQMLSTALNELMGEKVAPYKSTHKNHPCNLWARESYANFRNLVVHGYALCNEYARRFHKTHKCQNVIQECARIASVVNPLWHTTASTEPPLCMPEQYRDYSNIVDSYRLFYSHKPRMRYPKNKIPEWFLEYRGDRPFDIVEGK